MDAKPLKNSGGGACDCGPAPFTACIPACTEKNCCFRRALWTGAELQMTVMCIPVRGEVGLEVHPDTDQYIRVEQGRALVCLGAGKDTGDLRRCLGPGEAVFVPKGTWHNIVNAGSRPLKLSSVYAPPHHPRGTVHCSKADADRAEEGNK